MSFLSFSKKTKKIKADKEKYSLVFNIGSGGVSGGIIKFTEAPGENVIYYTKEKIPFQQDLSIPKHLELMKSTLTAVASKIQAEGFKKINSGKKSNPIIEKVFYIFSSPWSDSQTRTIRINEPKAIKITDKYLEKIITEQEKQFQGEIGKAGKIIEKKIIQIKNNGYVVNDIQNKLTKNLELSVLFTIAEETVLTVVEDAVAKIFNIKEVWCHSLVLSIFSVICDLFPQDEDFIHIDISEEITDIFLIKENVIVNNSSIPFGRNYFIRQLSVLSNVSEEIADSMVRMHSEKTNDELASLKLSVAMDNISREWLLKISAILDNLKERTFLPETIFLIANNDLTFFLKDKLQKMDYKVILIDNKKLKSNYTKDDIMFKLELMFLDKLYKI